MSCLSIPRGRVGEAAGETWPRLSVQSRLSSEDLPPGENMGLHFPGCSSGLPASLRPMIAGGGGRGVASRSCGYPALPGGNRRASWRLSADHDFLLADMPLPRAQSGTTDDSIISRCQEWGLICAGPLGSLTSQGGAGNVLTAKIRDPRLGQEA